MDKKLFLVVLDTTESTTLMGIGRGIVNNYVVLAVDELDARQVVLKIYNRNRNVQEQIRSSLYVYNLEDVVKPNLIAVDQKNGLPFFSFMPMNGARPPRQSETPNVSTTTGNKTLEPSIVPAQQQVPPAQQPKNIPKADPMQRVPVARTVNSSRSMEFQEGEHARPLVSDELNKDQADIIRRMGVVKTNDGQDEGVNPRINSSTGRNNNLTNTRSLPSTPNSMSNDKASILKKMGIGSPLHEADPVHDADIMEENAKALIDPSLAELDTHVLSDDDIKRMQDELDNQK